jgi:hypothetical protein
VRVLYFIILHQVAGTGVNLGLAFANPCALGGSWPWALRGLNGLQALGGLWNAGEHAQRGEWGSAAWEASGAFLNLLSLLRACFTGETKLWARGSWGQGWRRIDEMAVGDEVLSREENAPDGPLAWKRVEERFERVGLVCELEVSGGRRIGTTAEHPFYVAGKGWTAAGKLQPGE